MLSRESGERWLTGLLAWTQMFSTTIGLLPAEEDPRTQEIERQWAGLRGAPGDERREALQRVPGVLRPFFRKSRPTPGR